MLFLMRLPSDATFGPSPSRPAGVRPTRVRALPREAWDTVDLIEAGGPFPYPDNDDRRFGNYERALPEQPKNYYREYTVDTPGVSHRGARRIVTGGGADGQVDEWFYTPDHYESFCEMEVN